MMFGHAARVTADRRFEAKFLQVPQRRPFALNLDSGQWQKAVRVTVSAFGVESPATEKLSSFLDSFPLAGNEKTIFFVAQSVAGLWVHELHLKD
jgi:hypothetical protein